MTGEREIHIGCDGETYGPYTLDEVRSFAAAGQLGDSHFIWDAASGAWVAWRTWPGLGVTPPRGADSAASPAAASSASPVAVPAPESAEPLPYPCAHHADRGAVGHCDACGHLLCSSCVTFVESQFLCSSCKPAPVTSSSSSHALVARFLGPLADRPLAGAAIVLVLAVFAFSAGSRTEAAEGLSSGAATLAWQQGQRAITRARTLAALGETDRAADWYALAAERAEQLTSDAAVAPAIREQAYVFRMRAALDLGHHDQLNALITSYEKDFGSGTRENDLKFFRACDLQLTARDPKGAAELFQSLSWTEGDPDIGVLIDAMSQQTPAARERAKDLLTQAFTKEELYVRLGVCLKESGKKEEAEMWLKFALESDGVSPESLRWKKAAQEALAS